MVKSELVKIILKTHPDLSLYKAEKIINIFFEQISQSLIKNETSELRQFGSFYTRIKTPRKARNPSTNEVINVEEKILPCFRPSKNLIKLLNLSLKYNEY